MQIKLQRLTIENFKGIKSQEFTPDGHNAEIVGANGTGKTTIYDAFLWLLFGKDSLGKADFDIHPLDKENRPILGLHTEVFGQLLFDDRVRSFRRVLKEKIVKDQRKGWETFCWIDEVPQKIGEYQSAIKELIDEDRFKMLTDLHFFCEKIHWKDRRKMLLDMAGPVDIQAGFDELVAELMGREIDDFKKIVADQRKIFIKEKEEIPPRIDEIQRSVNAYSETTDDAELDQQRKELLAQIKTLDEERSVLLKSEKIRQQKIETISRMKNDLDDRARDLKNGGSVRDSLLEKKNKVQQALQEREDAVNSEKRTILKIQADIEIQAEKVKQADDALHKTRKEFTILQNADFSKEICSACGQILPAAGIQRLQKENQKKLNELSIVGTQQKQERKERQEKLDILNQSLDQAKQNLEKAQIQQIETKTWAADQEKKLDELLKQPAGIDPKTDPVWQQKQAEIKQLETELGPPVADQLESLEIRRKGKYEILNQIQATLFSSDQRKKNKVRIDELSQQEKDLVAKIAELDGKIEQIDQYQQAVSRSIEATVNGKFRCVNFKMFNTLLNGSIEPACEPMLDGRPYSACSYGERKLIGADIVHTLSEHYLVSAPVFIDNAESITLALPMECQQIRLIAEPNYQKLSIAIDDRRTAPDIIKRMTSPIESSPQEDPNNDQLF